jgi:hypothetical protein
MFTAILGSIVMMITLICILVIVSQPKRPQQESQESQGQQESQESQGQQESQEQQEYQEYQGQSNFKFPSFNFKFLKAATYEEKLKKNKLLSAKEYINFFNEEPFFDIKNLQFSLKTKNSFIVEHDTEDESDRLPVNNEDKEDPNYMERKYQLYVPLYNGFNKNYQENYQKTFLEFLNKSVSENKKKDLIVNHINNLVDTALTSDNFLKIIRTIIKTFSKIVSDDHSIMNSLRIVEMTHGDTIRMDEVDYSLGTNDIDTSNLWRRLKYHYIIQESLNDDDVDYFNSIYNSTDPVTNHQIDVNVNRFSFIEIEDRFRPYLKYVNQTGEALYNSAIERYRSLPHFNEILKNFFDIFVSDYKSVLNLNINCLNISTRWSTPGYNYFFESNNDIWLRKRTPYMYMLAGAIKEFHTIQNELMFFCVYFKFDRLTTKIQNVYISYEIPYSQKISKIQYKKAQHGDPFIEYGVCEQRSLLELVQEQYQLLEKEPKMLFADEIILFGWKPELFQTTLSEFKNYVKNVKYVKYEQNVNKNDIKELLHYILYVVTENPENYERDNMIKLIMRMFKKLTNTDQENEAITNFIGEIYYDGFEIDFEILRQIKPDIPEGITEKSLFTWDVSKYSLSANCKTLDALNLEHNSIVDTVQLDNEDIKAVQEKLNGYTIEEIDRQWEKNVSRIDIKDREKLKTAVSENNDLKRFFIQQVLTQTFTEKIATLPQIINKIYGTNGDSVMDTGKEIYRKYNLEKEKGSIKIERVGIVILLSPNGFVLNKKKRILCVLQTIVIENFIIKSVTFTYYLENVIEVLDIKATKKGGKKSLALAKHEYLQKLYSLYKTN